MEFREYLMGFRVAHDLSQEKTAQILGTDQKSICLYESQKRTPTKKHEIQMRNKMFNYEEENKNDEMQQLR